METPPLKPTKTTSTFAPVATGFSLSLSLSQQDDFTFAPFMEPRNRSGQLDVDQLRVRPLLLLSTSTTTIAGSTAHIQLSAGLGTFLVFLALFMLFFFLWLYSRYCVRGQAAARTARGRVMLMQLQRQGLRQQPDLPGEPRPPAPTTLLPVVAYSGVDGKAQDCVICLSEFGGKEMVKVIPCCGHVFHPECIDGWLALHDSCPVCRRTEILGRCDAGNRDHDLSLPAGSTDAADAQVTPTPDT